MIRRNLFLGALAWRSTRSRLSSLSAAAVVIGLGTAIAVAFASLIDCAAQSGVSRYNHQTLITVGAVVGGWAVLIVAFAIASTVGPAVSRRGPELALLRRLGLTRRQTDRLVVAETGAVAALSAGLAALPGVGLGDVVLHVLDGGVVHGSVPFTASASTVGLVVAATVLATVLAALWAVRHSSSRVSGRGEGAELSRTRRIVAGLCLLIAVNGSIMTVAEHSQSATQSMSTCGSASVVAAIGLALLAAPLLTRVAAVVPGAGLAGFVAARDARRRPGRLGTIVTPVVAFVAITTGTTYMVAVDHADRVHLGNGVELVNYLVTGMICLFAAIMTTSAIRAAVADRRRELNLLRLAGASASQARGSVLAGVALAALVGIALGVLASLTTSLPYGAVRPHGFQPLDGALIYGGASAAALALVLGVSAHAAGTITRATPVLEVAS